MLGVNRHLQIGARSGERISQAAGPLGLNGEGRSPLFRAVLRIHTRIGASQLPSLAFLGQVRQVRNRPGIGTGLSATHPDKAVATWNGLWRSLPSRSS